ncbi:MAG: 16S rRNA (cytidine(1402)-2'-O)-methyltransferase [Candidatus Caldatribacteriota bacterium]|nr:16S rRNA (cytidine(1402)-2'-O)-methyltransferase [Candidatus Caldatribacteriota bacterium]
MIKKDKEEIKNQGILYICGTPIGNLSDITLRALTTLKEVDLIAAEDTRHTQKLLNHYKIKKPVTSYHEHNKFKKTNYLINILCKGKKVALVSDAGMPGISDPGYVLINSAIEEKIEIIPIPGVSASLTALVVSGLIKNSFIFEGFLPRKSNDRKKYLKKNKDEKRTMIIYESPHRIKKTLADILEIWGDRKIALTRELTKKFEEIIRGSVSDVLTKIKQKGIKGEITLVIQGKIEQEGKTSDEFIKEEKIIEEHLKKLVRKGYSNKEIIEMSKEKLNIPKNIIYKKLLKIKKEIQDS